MTFEHTHSEEAYDEYKTEDGFHRITVVYENGKFTKLQIRSYASRGAQPNYSHYKDLEYIQLDEINQLITALHAAVSGMHKKVTERKPSNG